MKLRASGAADARRRVLAAGVSPLRPRRLQHDVLVDTPDRRLLAAGSALRVRADGDRAFLTFKGPVVPGPLKVREEIETEAASGAALLGVLAALGYTPAFRYEKYREEYAADGAIVAIDETPIGTFIEIEGTAAAIHALAAAFGYDDADYVTASYRALFLAAAPGGTDMLFPGAVAGRP
ncbi:MAG: class IV adenylate cyclase [Vicinamibacterales bacterium]